ncbi:Aste57867_2921 [Aphanomyces stellatus]|uniref:Aste57867_2921 protein n=1 Tax=Aphanomyces stellatus TaxID=120398 RepID=A0A485K9N2_9STRA|nr:hypothetical protein As57867_002913 [Aphanomyces stellatus]VFT80104.1 Aste57867_2921 [Aphanomyces stellatus]
MDGAASETPNMLGSSGGTMLQDILRTAAQPEEAIVSFQKQYGLKEDTSASLQLLDLLGCRRPETHSKLLDTMVSTLLKRIQSKHISEAQLQKLLELTFPYLEVRELRAIPIAVLAAQQSTPPLYLQELCDHDNRALLDQFPMHVKRRIWSIAPHELRLEVDKVVGAYIQHKRALLFASSATPFDLHTHSHASMSPEDRRKQDPILATLVDMVGDSAELYLQVVDMVRAIAASGVLPGHELASPKDYVYLAPFIGTLRNDMANIQRDHATPLVRTDPLHKFIWFLDLAVKRGSLDSHQLMELLLVVRKLRLRDLPRKDTAAAVPPNKETLLKIADQLTKADGRRIFADPVPDDVEGYHDVIKHPMDISTLRDKVRQLKYMSLDAFASDVKLMFTNCMTYNDESTVYYKDAKRLEKTSAAWIEKAQAAALAETTPPCLLGSTGAIPAAEANETEKSGMVFEGECDPLLADVVLLLSDPTIKPMLFHVLWHALQRKPAGTFPTDDPMARGLVQLLQLGSIGSVRRMVRKQEYVLRSPPVLSLRVALPLYSRLNLVRQHPTLLAKLTDVDDADGFKVLWTNGSHLKSLVRQFLLVAIHDHWPIAIAQSIVRAMTNAGAVDEAFLKDPLFLHSLVQGLLKHKQKDTLLPLFFDTVWLPAARAEHATLQAASATNGDAPTVVVPLETMHVAAARLLTQRRESGARVGFPRLCGAPAAALRPNSSKMPTRGPSY